MTETVRTTRDREPRSATSTFTQFLSSETLSLSLAAFIAVFHRVSKHSHDRHGHSVFHTELAIVVRRKRLILASMVRGKKVLLAIMVRRKRLLLASMVRGTRLLLAW